MTMKDNESSECAGLMDFSSWLIVRIESEESEDNDENG